MKDSLPKEEYNVQEFAKLMNLSEQYVRHCCNEYTDSKGTTAKLPEGYYPLPPRGWLIKKQNRPTNLDNLLGADQSFNSTEALQKNPSRSFKSNSILYEGREITISNKADFIVGNHFEVYLGDCIIYLLSEKLLSPFFDITHNRKHLDGRDVLTQYLPLVLKWLAIAQIPINNPQLKQIKKSKKDFCYNCGCRIKYKNKRESEYSRELDLVYRGHFCCEQHYNDFKRTFGKKANKKNRQSYFQELITFKEKALTLIQGSKVSELKKLSIKLVGQILDYIIRQYKKGSHNITKKLDQRIENKKKNKIRNHFRKVKLEDIVASELINGITSTDRTQKLIDQWIKNNQSILFLLDLINHTELEEYCNYTFTHKDLQQLTKKEIEQDFFIELQFKLYEATMNQTQ